jgi:hypothetical protein
MTKPLYVFILFEFAILFYVYKGPNNGSWNVVNHKLFKPGYILCWSVVNFERNLERDPQRLQNFITILVQCLTSLGMFFALKRLVCL